nr:hypothetical protein [Bradyrhizobium sp. SZCCHNR2028]
MSEPDVASHNRMRAGLIAATYIVRRIVVTELKSEDGLVATHDQRKIITVWGLERDDVQRVQRSRFVASHADYSFKFCKR